MNVITEILIISPKIPPGLWSSHRIFIEWLTTFIRNANAMHLIYQRSFKSLDKNSLGSPQTRWTFGGFGLCLTKIRQSQEDLLRGKPYNHRFVSFSRHNPSHIVIVTCMLYHQCSTSINLNSFNDFTLHTRKQNRIRIEKLWKCNIVIKIKLNREHFGNLYLLTVNMNTNAVLSIVLTT